MPTISATSLRNGSSVSFRIGGDSPGTSPVVSHVFHVSHVSHVPPYGSEANCRVGWLRSSPPGTRMLFWCRPGGRCCSAGNPVLKLNPCTDDTWPSGLVGCSGWAILLHVSLVNGTRTPAR